MLRVAREAVACAGSMLYGCRFMSQLLHLRPSSVQLSSTSGLKLGQHRGAGKQEN